MGEAITSMLASLLVTVVGGVTCHYVIKWLERRSTRK